MLHLDLSCLGIVLLLLCYPKSMFFVGLKLSLLIILYFSLNGLIHIFQFILIAQTNFNLNKHLNRDVIFFWYNIILFLFISLV